MSRLIRMVLLLLCLLSCQACADTVLQEAASVPVQQAAAWPVAPAYKAGIKQSNYVAWVVSEVYPAFKLNQDTVGMFNKVCTKP